MKRNRINPRVFGIMGGIVLWVGLLTPFTMGSTEQVQQLFQSAEDLYGQGDYEGALAKYTEALEASMKEGVNTAMIDKDFKTLVHYKIAVVYSRLAQKSGDVSHYKTAIDHIEKVILTAVVPKHKEALIYLWGHTLYKTKQFKQAELKFKQLIENFPDSLFVENAWYAIGQSNYKLRDYEDARQAFKSVLDGFPNSDFKDDAQHLIAQSFLNESNYEQAYREFDKIATEEFRNYPNLQAEAMYKAAYSLQQLGKDDEATIRYANFVTLFPESPYAPAAHFDQGAIYVKQKDYHSARISYESALHATTNRSLQAEIQSAIGRTYFDQKDHENAIVAYNVLLEKYPNSDFIAAAKLGIADSQFRIESWDEAIRAYERIINEHPEKIDFIPYCFYRIGEACYKYALANSDNLIVLEKLEAAFKRVINEYENSQYAVDAYHGLALVYRDTSRWTLLLEIADTANKKYTTSDNDRVLEILAKIALLRDVAIKNIASETVK